MSSLEMAIQNHIEKVDGFLNFEAIYNKNLVEWFRPLINDITEDGAIPYLMGEEKGERYRASPLASMLVWLERVGLLPDKAIDVMQDKLLFLRDNCEEHDTKISNNIKKVEDMDGWSLAEGVSVWSTSMAIIALSDSQEIGLTKTEKYKSSVLWLAKQRELGKNGWGYQLSGNCTENVIMTSLALRAIASVMKNKEVFMFSNDEETILTAALTTGFQYLKDNIKYKKKKGEAYWSFINEEHCTATTWALMAIKKMSELNINVEIEKFYNDNLKMCTEFILNCMPKECERWKSEQIVCEAGAKYGRQKNYYSFMPTLILDFLDLGISPYNPKVINQMRWLLKNQSEWKIEQYDRGKICTFTYAMLLATITKWTIQVGVDNAPHLLRESVTKKERLLEKIYGMTNFLESEVQIVYKTRITLFWIMSILFLIVIFNSKNIVSCIAKVVEKLLQMINTSLDDILINIVASGIYAILIAIGVLVMKLIRKRFRSVKFW